MNSALINDQGWHLGARWCRSPNFNARPDGELITLLVVHNISLPPNEFANPYIEQFFCNQLDAAKHAYFQTIKGLEVSAHFLIKRTGELIQFVSTNDRAWHAGQSQFEGRENCNDFSIGVELEGADDLPYTAEQYAQLSKLAHELETKYPSLTTRAGHNQIAPGRKTDPGPAFNWELFRWPS